MARKNNKDLRDIRATRKSKKQGNGWAIKLLTTLKTAKEGNTNG
jgi:hypothetical protein